MAETRKSIVFQAKIDTSEIGPTIESMKRQFTQATGSTGQMSMQAQTAARLSQQGMGGVLSVPKPDDIAKSKRALEQFIREQSQQQEKLYKLLENQRDKMQKLQTIKKDSLRDSKEELALEEKKKAVLEQYIRMDEQYRERDKTLNRAIDMSGGRAPNSNRSTGAMDFVKAIAMPAGVAAATEIAKKVINQYMAMPREIAVSTGAATQGLIGNRLQDLQGGDMVKSMAFRKEWNESLGMAQTEQQNPLRKLLSRFTSAKGLMSMSPLAALMSGGKTESAFQSEQMEQQIEKAQSIYTAKMQNDPMKMAAVNMYQQNFMRDLSAQRTMGLSDRGYFGAGGYQETGNKAGFNPELALGMSAQIQGAGGSTRGARGLSVLGLQAQRGFDMTNAGGVLGRISGTAGDTKSSEQIFKKLMEESIKAGLDKSEFREEQRRFADAASEVLANSGVKTAADAAQTLAGFSKFLPGGEPTIKGLEGARGAYEQMQSLTSQTSGRGGAMQMASAMKNPQLKKLGAAGIGELMRIPESNMISSNEDIIGAAAEIGGDMTPRKLADTLKQMKRNDMLLTLGLDPDEIDEFAKSPEGKAFRQTGGRGTELLNKRHLATWRKIQKQSQYGVDYQSPQQQAAFNIGLLGMEGSAGTAGGATTYESGLTGTTGRMGDAAVAASAQVSQEFLENFREFGKVMTPSTEAVAEWTKQLVMSATVLRYTAEGNQAAAQKALAEQMVSKNRSRTQNQVGRGSSSGW
jgi:hypothetical protein